MFNKDLEELKNKLSMMNNTITEMKNILEGINSRKVAVEEQISELENGMIGITAMEQSKEWREMRIFSQTSGTTLNAPTLKRKRNSLRKYLKRL